MTEFDVLLWPQALEAWRFYWPCLSAHWWLWVLPLFYSSETLYLAAFSAIKHCYCTQCSSVWGVREAYCSLTGSQLLGRFGAELSQHFLFFLHKDSSSLIKHSPSLCLDITNLFFFLFPASWGLFFFFVFLCFVLLHLIWGDSFSWNKVSVFCLLLKPVSQQKGSVTEKTQGKVHSAYFFVCYERTMGIFDGSPVQVCWDPWRKSLWVLPMPLLPHPSGVTHCDCLHTPPPAAQGAAPASAPAPAPAPVTVSPGSPGLTLPPRIRVDALLYNLHLLTDPATLLDGLAPREHIACCKGCVSCITSCLTFIASTVVSLFFFFLSFSCVRMNRAFTS